MADLTIFRSNLSSPALVLSSGGGRSTSVLLKSSAEAVFATAAAGAALISSNRNGASRMVNSGGRRVLWIGARSTPTVGRVVTGAESSRAGTDPAGRRGRADAAASAAPPELAADAAAPAADLSAPPLEVEPPPAVEVAEAAEAPAPPAAEARPASKLELAIDSLPGYELVKPIPVIVESLGNKVFVADVPDLDISITGTSVSGALLQLKDQIVRIYEGHRSKKNLDAERTRQLGKLESYIVKRRNWF